MPEGIFIAVVGPSGAGKDTLLRRAADLLSNRGDIQFVRRVITRPSDGVTEDHDTLTPERFAEARQAGAFSVTWGAHGMLYGLPASAGDAVISGKAVVANVSRGMLEHCLASFRRLAIIEIVVDERILAHRIACRGRETGADIDLRLKRSVETVAPAGSTHVRVENSGSLDEAIEAFVQAIRSLAIPPSPPSGQSDEV